MQLGALPRIRLASLPTPLEEAPRLAEALSGPRIFIKRDDLTGLALGGNKARKLEFLMGEARARGCDVVITTGAVQSNHARQTAAAARKVGLHAVLVLSGEESAELQGNLLLDHLLGAEVRVIQSTEQYVMLATMEDVAREFTARGHRPYVIPSGGATAVGALGFVEAVIELISQMNVLGVKADAIVTSSGTGGTQAGLYVGCKTMASNIDVIGISPGSSRDVVTRRVLGIVEDLTRLLKLEFRAHPDDIIVYDEYRGAGYGILSPECADAIRLVARTEGILLDPVYTGKAMAGLIDLVRKGRFGATQTVVFWHTGGQPALFAYHDALSR
ncbi:MAG: D-cysteine desulfhydrase family protein [Armatimonadetes bacterium]|nr:D-cysteine desulfhydrase family protein [Armatimonadota bacterium]